MYMNFPLLLGWVLVASAAHGQAACVDDGCQEGIQASSLLQSGSGKTKLKATALEDDQPEQAATDVPTAAPTSAGSDCDGKTEDGLCWEAGCDWVAQYDGAPGHLGECKAKPAATSKAALDTSTAPSTTAADFHANKKVEHSRTQTNFTSTNDCEECITAEKYVADNATECIQKHSAAEQDLAARAGAEKELAACEQQKLADQAAAASAKSEVTLKLTEVKSATAADDRQMALEGANSLCSELIGAWIAKEEAVVLCDIGQNTLAQAKGKYEASRAAATACDIQVQTAKDEAALACGTSVDAEGA